MNLLVYSTSELRRSWVNQQVYDYESRTWLLVSVTVSHSEVSVTVTN